MSKFVLPRLKRYRQCLCGYPYGMSERQWDAILDKMIMAFQSIVDEEDSSKCLTNEELDAAQEGFELFGKHFRTLWD